MTSPTRPPIRFSIVTREAGAVQVVIYDVAGRRLRVFDLRHLEQGAHVFSWDGTDRRGEPVPAGVYWIQARLPGAAETKRLVLVK
jgi:flagellar hook assembly protein FlgD